MCLGQVGVGGADGTVTVKGEGTAGLSGVGWSSSAMVFNNRWNMCAA